ncbi:MAG: patatin family protein [Acidobacteriota bacterium]
MSDIAALLRARAASGSVPTGRTDGARIALCIEGGAMRAVIAGGMMMGLAELGLTDAFDAVYGSSAGAICGAYFLARQTAIGTRIFSEDINNRRFASRRRALIGGAIVDLDFLVNDIMVTGKPLNTDAVIAAGTPLAVIATDVTSGRVALLRDFSTGDELRAALRAGATMPIVAGGPHLFRGRHYFDASLSEPIPLRSADEEGFTHIVVALTRPRGVPRDVSWFDRWIVAPNLRRWSDAMADGFLARTAPYAEVQDQIARGRSPSGRAAVLGIRPAITVGKLERDRARLLAGAASGRDAVLTALAAR